MSTVESTDVKSCHEIIGDCDEKSENKESLSRKESSSSSEYVVVGEQPSNLTSPVLEYAANEREISDAIALVPTNVAVGKSIFYDCLDASPLNENNSFHKSDTDDGEYANKTE